MTNDKTPERLSESERAEVWNEAIEAAVSVILQTQRSAAIRLHAKVLALKRPIDRLTAAPAPAVELRAVTEEEVEAGARIICKSGRFETGEGTCALLCMDQLGDARVRCKHVSEIHGKLVRDVINAAQVRARQGRE